jgi:hypothetical protein
MHLSAMVQQNSDNIGVAIQGRGLQSGTVVSAAFVYISTFAEKSFYDTFSPIKSSGGESGSISEDCVLAQQKVIRKGI